jgi:AraC family transcriptional regulator of adaptative response/methylated-DNA-[protein]-cysteine methyltransferase
MSAILDRQITMDRNDHDIFWDAVLSRDARFDGQFVFAVHTTKIFCRPSCPARRPRRDRVSFFALPEAAAQAGFRACKRCLPQQASLLDPQVEMVQRVCRLIETSLDEMPGLETLSAEVGLSSFHLQRTFKNVMGISPREYAEAIRMSRFRSGVRSGDSVTNAMYDAGYGSSSRLYERANSELGMTPATYGRGGKEVAIDYATSESPLGFLLVAATSKGICAVRLGDSIRQLESDLKSEYAAAEIRKSEGILDSALREIVAHLEGRQPKLSLPLDIRSTAFQRQVWQALQAIPYGATRSYGEVAKAIGQPKAVRAVARACATNPVALVIPCHRVIREDTSLGGYRWGIERKKKLLANEKRER